MLQRFFNSLASDKPRTKNFVCSHPAFLPHRLTSALNAQERLSHWIHQVWYKGLQVKTADFVGDAICD